MAGDEVALDDLLRFFDNPARAFLRSRLGMVLPEVPEERGEGIPITLDGLEKWTIGDRMLQAHLRGADLDVLAAAEWRRGSVPPRELGARVVGDLRVEVGSVASAAASWTSSPAERVDLVVDLSLGPFFYRHLLTGAPVDRDFAHRLVDVALR